jgi:methylated-DNA-[protein]-cysteine S-methyltransferase
MDEPVAVRTTIAGKWGPIFVAATDRGVVALEWLTTDQAFDAAVSRRLTGRVVQAGTVKSRGSREQHLGTGVKWVEAFLSGRPPRDRDRPPVDLTDRNAWDRRVLEAVATIPWGHTASYGEIARRIGSPRASQAVGGALGRNPIMFLIPCHRVIASDGTLGGWGGDRWGDTEHRLRNKQNLLLREGVTAVPRAV